MRWGSDSSLGWHGTPSPASAASDVMWAPCSSECVWALVWCPVEKQTGAVCAPNNSTDHNMKINNLILLLLSAFCEALPTVKVSNDSLPSAMVSHQSVDQILCTTLLQQRQLAMHKRFSRWLSAARNRLTDHRIYTVGPESIGFPFQRDRFVLIAQHALPIPMRRRFPSITWWTVL